MPSQFRDYPDFPKRGIPLRGWTDLSRMMEEFTTTAPPTTIYPSTPPPTTLAPTTPVYTTIYPSTVAPTTVHVATTPPPTTLAPTTEAPTTAPPTTLAPTTTAPTTIVTTAAPTTVAPTTLAPTTLAPTTLEPTTEAPTTLAPTTLAPTTAIPTTVAPTTENDYATDFSEYAHDVDLTTVDWTSRWHTGNNTYKAKDAAYTLGCRQLFGDNTTGSGRNPISWDAVPLVSNIEILYKFKLTSGNDYEGRGYVRGGGTDLTETAYFTEIQSGDLKISRYVNGTYANIATYAASFPINTWLWIRFQAIGTALRARCWVHGTAEPGAWQINTTDNNIPGPGWVGLGANSRDTYWDFFSVDINPGSADFPLSTTCVPTTLAPTTLAATTSVPTTEAPTTLAPTTLPATTEAPTTLAPTTVAATTTAPTTLAPTTLAGTTAVPTTAVPTTTLTTVTPTTAVPTTVPPTTEYVVCLYPDHSLMTDTLSPDSLITDTLNLNSLITDTITSNSPVC